MRFLTINLHSIINHFESDGKYNDNIKLGFRLQSLLSHNSESATLHTLIHKRKGPSSIRMTSLQI